MQVFVQKYQPLCACHSGLVTILIFSIFICANATNLISNGDMELGATGWKLLIQSNIADIEYVIGGDGLGENDSKGTKIIVKKPPLEDWQVQLQPSQWRADSAVYSLSFKAKGNGVLKVYVQGPGPDWKVKEYAFFNLRNEWEEHSMSFLADQKGFGLNNINFNIGSIKDTLFIDNVVVEQADLVWYNDASTRVDKYRKNDFSLKAKTGDSARIELVRHEFPFGTALALNVKQDSVEKWYRAIAAEYFWHGVSESAFKWFVYEPQKGNIKKTEMQEYIKFAEDNGWDLRGHTLVWAHSSGVKHWSAQGSCEDFERNLKERIERDLKEYKGIITEYDVWNEPIHQPYFFDKCGWQLLDSAYVWAHRADPAAKLYINEYDVVAASETERYYAIIKGMLDRSVPVHGIGVQSHFSDHFVNPSMIKGRFDKLASLGLPIKVTELDFGYGTMVMSEEEQAKRYKTFLTTAFSHPAVNGILLWGFWDKRHWITSGGIIASDGRAKPAADTIYKLWHEIWTTKDTLAANKSGRVNFRGFPGRYKLTIGDREEFMYCKMGQISCVRDNWKDTSYRITYHLNDSNLIGKPGTLLSNTYTHGIDLPLPKPEKDIYTFMGWHENRDFTDEPYFTMPAFEMGDKELWAKWRLNTYPVVFNSNGGTAIPGIAELEHFQLIPVPSSDPKKYGYTFRGWYKDEAFRNEWIPKLDTIKSAVTFHAKWELNIYNVTFDADGGTVNPSIMRIGHGNPVPIPVTPYKPCHAFLGWYKDKALTTEWDFSEEIIGPITIYAKWQLDYCTVSFNTNGGLPLADTLKGMVVGNIIPKPVEPKKEGYIFVDWFYDASYSKVAALPLPLADNAALHAKWVKEPIYIERSIAIPNPLFTKDDMLSNYNTTYFIADASLCATGSTDVEIGVNNKHVGLEIGGAIATGGIPDGKGGMVYSHNIPLNPQGGLDTLRYSLFGDYDLSEDVYSVIVASPLQFDRIVKQKWNNVLVVNNNPATNGGFNLTEFMWYKNGKETGDRLQHYSAGPSSADRINEGDKFNVQVGTEEGIRINSCVGYLKIAAEKQSKAFQRQVLGIGRNADNLPAGTEIYNPKGERSTGNTPGLYIIKKSAK